MYWKNSLTVLFLLLLLVVVGCSSIVSAASDLSGAKPDVESPQEVVEGFYAWLLDYIGNRAEGEFHNPMVERAYRDSDALSQAYIKELDRLMESDTPLGHDPLLCAQDIPEFVEVNEIIIEEYQAVAQMGSSFPNHSFEVHLEQTEGTWKIANIVCR